MKKILSWISAAVLLVLLVSGAIEIYIYTNGFNESFKTFYLQHNGERIVTADSTLTFEHGEENIFSVRYTFDTKTSKAKDYTVRIIPNSKSSFDYYVDGRKTAWKDSKDLTQLFTVKKSEKSFTLTVSSDTTFETVLQELYGGKEIDISGAEEYEKENPYLYDLVVSSYNDGVIYHIRFGVMREEYEVVM